MRKWQCKQRTFKQNYYESIGQEQTNNKGTQLYSTKDNGEGIYTHYENMVSDIGTYFNNSLQHGHLFSNHKFTQINPKTGNKYPKENILITPGSKEAMLLMHIAFNGEIIIPAPGWVSYEPQAQIGSNKVHWLETSRANNWFPTANELEKKIKKILGGSGYINASKNNSLAVLKPFSTHVLKTW